MTNRRIAKVILEVRYPHAALLLDKRGAIAKKWRGVSSITDWRISDHQVNLYNKEKTIFFDVQLTQLAAVMDFPKNLNEFFQVASDFTNSTIETLGIRQITRVGIRVLQIEDKNDFTTLMNNMRRRLCLPNDEDWERLGVSVQDIGVSYVLNLGEYSGNFNLGPMQKDQLSTNFISEESKNILPETCLFVDFDLFKEQPEFHMFSSKGRINAFLTSGIEQVISFSNNFINLYGGFE